MPDLNETLQPTVQEDAPVVIDKRPQVVSVDTNQLDTTPQVVDGRVRVSDDISKQAEEQGYEPDVQPRAAAPGLAVTTGVADSTPGSVEGSILPDTTAGQIQGLRNAGNDAEADAIIEKASAVRAAADVIQAPLSVKAEVAGAAAVEEGGAVNIGEGVVPAPVAAEDLGSTIPPSSVPDVTKAPDSSGAVPLAPAPDATVLEQPKPAPEETQPIIETDPNDPPV